MDNKLSALIGFLAGLAVGAVVALLYAPTSGEELRGQIRTEVNEEYVRASAELDKRMRQAQASLDETRREVKAYIDQMVLREKGATPPVDPSA